MGCPFALLSFFVLSLVLVSSPLVVDGGGGGGIVGHGAVAAVGCIAIVASAQRKWCHITATLSIA